MVKFVEIDEKVPFFKQLEEDVGPVILINKFNVSPEDVDQFLKLWAAPAAIAKKQPGFISAQLYRGTAGSCVFVAYVVFESAELLKQALNNPDFLSRLSDYPPSTVSSTNLFKKVAVPGICVD
jgi:quinol monooxygenase YgiN